MEKERMEYLAATHKHMLNTKAGVAPEWEKWQDFVSYMESGGYSSVRRLDTGKPFGPNNMRENVIRVLERTDGRYKSEMHIMRGQYWRMVKSNAGVVPEWEDIRNFIDFALRNKITSLVRLDPCKPYGPDNLCIEDECCRNPKSSVTKDETGSDEVVVIKAFQVPAKVFKTSAFQYYYRALKAMADYREYR